MKKILLLTLLISSSTSAFAANTLTIQCDALNGIRYGIDGKGMVAENKDGFSPKSSTTIVWKSDAKTATISTGDARATPSTETANLINYQKNFITWSLTNYGATEIWTYNFPTKKLLYSAHIQQYDLQGGTAGTVFLASCQASAK